MRELATRGPEALGRARDPDSRGGGERGARGRWGTAARVLVGRGNGGEREGVRRRRPGMGDDEFVGGENGEGKRLVVFSGFGFGGRPEEGFGWGFGPVALAWWWFASPSLRCGAVRCGRRGARRDWIREKGVQARRAGVVWAVLATVWPLVSSQLLLGSTVPILLSQSPLEWSSISSYKFTSIILKSKSNM